MKKVLVVEDDAKMRKMLVDALKGNGFDVAEAENGQEGLKVCTDFRPDLILLDVIMPVMDGITMLKKLKEEEWSKNIIVTILSNSDDLGKISDALEKGVSGYIIKSDLSIEDMIKRVKKELE